MRLASAALLLVVASLAGCASSPKDVVFATKTSLAIDVASLPGASTIGYDRFEGYIGPRFDNGNVPAVAASFVTNGALLGRQVRQVYATGKAAEYVTRPDDTPGTLVPGPQPGKDTQVMVFSTATTVGLKLGFGTTGVTDWFTLGYKRRELSVIPITESEFPSVLATVETDQDAKSRDETRFGVGQYFATGVAAQAVANTPEVRKLFKHRLTSALTSTEMQEKTQAETALSTLGCLTALPDTELPRVFTHAETLKLFEKDAPGLPARLKAMPAADARVTYTRYLAATDGTESVRTQAMADHRTVVCALAGR